MKVKTIKLLDDSVWDKTELIKKMNDDDFYYKKCGDTMLSSSICKNLLDSYKKYYYIKKYGSDSSDALTAGWLFHTAILEPHIFNAQIFIDVQSKNTLKWKKAKEEHPDEKIFTIKEKGDAEKLADSFLKNSKLVSYLNKAEFEVPMAGEIMGMPFRGKADIITKDGDIIDLKTTTKISQFKYSANTFSYDMQCYIYCNLFGITYDKFKIIAIDKKSLVSKYFNVSEEFYLRGENKCQKAIEEYNLFADTDINEYLKIETL